MPILRSHNYQIMGNNYLYVMYLDSFFSRSPALPSIPLPSLFTKALIPYFLCLFFVLFFLSSIPHPLPYYASYLNNFFSSWQHLLFILVIFTFSFSNERIYTVFIQASFIYSLKSVVSSCIHLSINVSIISLVMAACSPL